MLKRKTKAYAKTVNSMRRILALVFVKWNPIYYLLDQINIKQ